MVTETPPPTVSQQTAEDAPLWNVRGPVNAAPISPLYRLGMATVAIAMVLLPFLYIALIVGVVYATWRHGVNGLEMFESKGGAKGKLFAYIAPLIIGALVVLFMIKPLFARRQKETESLEVSRDEEPALFAFIEEICDLVSAPRPKRVLVDLEVNASASFRRGFLSLFGHDLTLTIGLPLVAGLNMRQLGGVLGHEFGHFAQGAGMRLTFIIRSINAWFSRIVYERDAWDEYLTTTARNIDLRVGIILHLARLMIWLTRKVLCCFMMAGHGISCFMLRQMEFDADHYETQVSGSRSFSETAQRMRLLSVGLQRAVSQQQEAFQGKRLVNDLPGLIAIETHRLPADVAAAMQAAAGESTTGWFDTHPSDADRVRAAEHQGVEGVLVAEGSAIHLFADFPKLAEKATETYYRDECELDLQGVRFLPLSEMAAEAAAQAEAERSMNEMFGELLSIRTLLFFDTPPPTDPGLDPVEIESGRIAQQTLLEQVPPIMKQLLEADSAEILAAQAKGLLDAGYKIKKDEFRLSDGTRLAADTAANQARASVEQHRTELQPVIDATRQRLQRAVALFAGPGGLGTSEEAGELGNLLRVLASMSAAERAVVELRKDQAAMELLLDNASEGVDDKWNATAQVLAVRINGSVMHIFAAVKGVNYPFPHANGTVNLAEFLGDSSSHEDATIQAFLRGQAVLDRFLNTYFRTMARLAALAKSSESTVALQARSEVLDIVGAASVCEMEPGAVDCRR